MRQPGGGLGRRRPRRAPRRRSSERRGPRPRRARARPREPRGKHRLDVAVVGKPLANPAAHGRSSRRSGRPTTATRACSRFGQDPRWRRFLVSRIDAGPGRRGARRRDRHGCGRDRARPAARLLASSGSTRARRCSRRPPSASRRGGLGDASGSSRAAPRRCRSPTRRSTALTFTYLLRYVDDPRATLAELARVVRPRRHGRLARVRACRAASARAALGALRPCRAAGRSAALIRPAGTRSAGSSARASASTTRALPRRAPARALAGGRDRRRPRAAPEPRRRRRDLGPQRMTAESRPAFYALAPGGWRDYVTLLHPPYTLWHLSYVAIGAALAPGLDGRAARHGARGVLARGRGRRARARRAARPAAARRGSPTGTLVGARGRLDRRRRRDRRSARARLDGLARAVRRGRRRSRLRLQPRALRRASSTATRGSRSPGARFRCSPAYLAAAERLTAEALLAAAFAGLLSLAQRQLSTQVRTRAAARGERLGHDRAARRRARAS